MASAYGKDVSAFGQHRKFPAHARKTSGTQGRIVLARKVFQSSQVVLDTAPYYSACTAEILLRLSGSSKIEFDSNCSTANEIIVNETKPSNYFLHLITLLIRQAERMATEIT